MNIDTKRKIYRWLGTWPVFGELFGGKGGPQSVVGFFLQRVVGINRRVPWPVHFTSMVLQPENVRLGRNTCPGLSPGNYIQAINGIEIGDNTLLGPGVGLISADHDMTDLAQHPKTEPIRIGRDCWIGMNAVVLPGVQLGDHVVVGAGSVVTKNFPANVVVAGNPARIIRHLSQEEMGSGA